MKCIGKDDFTEGSDLELKEIILTCIVGCVGIAFVMLVSRTTNMAFDSCFCFVILCVSLQGFEAGKADICFS